MSAELLRRAARRLDQVADGTTPGTWGHYPASLMVYATTTQTTAGGMRAELDRLNGLDADDDSEWKVFDEEYHCVGGGSDIEPGLGAYLEALQPCVARAVADLLRVTADTFGTPGHRDWHGREKALSVARAVLGVPS